MLQQLDERLSFDTLFRISDPKRVARSFKVRGPPLEIDSYQDSVYYIFNFKSSPSTTGLRHRGYIKFFKPKSGRDTPLQKVDCLVDCGCPDYRYVWAWSNKQRGSSLVGPQSLNQAWNKAPKIKNKSGKPGLCKHLLAAREYIYGLLASFPGDEPDTAYKLNKLTKWATKRWTNYPELMQQAKAKEQEIRNRINQRNVYGKVIEPLEPELAVPPAQDIEPEKPEEVSKPEPTEQDLKNMQPEPLPSTNPYSTVPTAPIKRPAGRPVKPVVGPYGMSVQTPARPAKPGPYGGYATKAEQDFRRRQGLGDSMQILSRKLLIESVHNIANSSETMAKLTEVKRLVQEMEDDQIELNSLEGGDGFSDGAIGMDEPLEPSEPPISDTAIGADSEGDTALGLLRQMRDLLAQLVTTETGEGEEVAEIEGELEGNPPMPTEGEAEAEASAEDEVDVPPADEEIPAEGKPEEEETEEEEEEKPRNRRPSD